MRALTLAATLAAAAHAAMTPASLEVLNCRPATTTPLFRLGFEVPEPGRGGPAGTATVTINDRSADVLGVRFSGAALLVTVAAPYLDLGSMEGRTLDFDVAWSPPNGQPLRAAKLVRWTSGDLAAVHNDVCSAEESRAAPNAWSSTPIWRPVLVFLGYAGLWLIAAFALPRLIWPPEEDAIRPLRRA